MISAIGVKHRVWLLFGGNEGNVVVTFRGAFSALENRAGRVITQSGIYSSAAWNMPIESMPSENRVFLNMAVEIETELSPLKLLNVCKKIEREFGRDTLQCACTAYRSRPIDIDIIFYDDIVYNNTRLFIPHPLAHIREFVLKPLCEICPDKIHPLYRKTVRELFVELRY